MRPVNASARCVWQRALLPPSCLRSCRWCRLHQVGKGPAQLLQRGGACWLSPACWAFLTNIYIFGAPLIAVPGLVIALCRDVRAPALYPLRLFGAIYTDVFRGLPVILVIYLVGFGIPGLGLPRPWNSPYIWGSLALILVYAAYVAEIIRSGIDSIHSSQRAAAASLGLNEKDTMRFVVLPQAIRNVAPANMNMFIALQKDVALLSFIGPVEIFRQAGVYNPDGYLTPYVGAALIFLAVTIPATRYADYLMQKQRRART